MSNESSTARGRDGIGLDRLFEAFSEGRRRRAVRILAASSAPVAFEELAEAVVADEVDGGGASVDEAIASFHHNHLPKLAESGLVRYDGPGTGVEYTATPRLDEAVGALLDVDAQFG